MLTSARRARGSLGAGRLPACARRRSTLRAVRSCATEHGVRSILCEGGPALNASLLARASSTSCSSPWRPCSPAGTSHDRHRRAARGARRLELVGAPSSRASFSCATAPFAPQSATQAAGSVAAFATGASTRYQLRPMPELRARTQGARARREADAGRAPVVEFRDVTKVYDGGSVGLERVSLRIGRGEFVFLVGPTGCGKSTCIRLLMKELEPSAGRDPDRRPRAARRCSARRCPYLRRNIGVVFQDYKLLPNRTVVRQRRLLARGDRRDPRGDPPQGAGHPAPRRALDQASQLPGRALGRRAAARLDRARVREPPAAAARRRADRQPRPRDLDRDHAADLPDQPHRHDRRRRDPRPRDGRQDAPPRDRAAGGPRRSATRSRASTAPTSPRASSPSACAARWASAPRATPTRRTTACDSASSSRRPSGRCAATPRRASPPCSPSCSRRSCSASSSRSSRRRPARRTRSAAACVVDVFVAARRHRRPRVAKLKHRLEATPNVKERRVHLEGAGARDAKKQNPKASTRRTSCSARNPLPDSFRDHARRTRTRSTSIVDRIAPRNAEGKRAPQLAAIDEVRNREDDTEQDPVGHRAREGR